MVLLKVHLSVNPRDFLSIARDMRFPERLDPHFAVGVATQKPKFVPPSNPNTYIDSGLLTGTNSMTFEALLVFRHVPGRPDLEPSMVQLLQQIWTEKHTSKPGFNSG
jgi:hypothetical protein